MSTGFGGADTKGFNKCNGPDAFDKEVERRLKRLASDFKESEHPRATDGKFGSGGGSGKEPPKKKPKIKKQPWDESTKDTPEHDIRKADKKIAEIKKQIEELKNEYAEKFGTKFKPKEESSEGSLKEPTGESPPINHKDKSESENILLSTVKEKDYDRFVDLMDNAFAKAKVGQVPADEAKKIKKSHAHTFDSDPDNDSMHGKGINKRGKEVKDPSIIVQYNGEYYALDGQHRLNRAIESGTSANVAIVDGSFLKEFPSVIEAAFSTKK